MPNTKYSERQRASLKLWIELMLYSNKLEQIIDDKLRHNYGQNISRFDDPNQVWLFSSVKQNKGLLAHRL